MMNCIQCLCLKSLRLLNQNLKLCYVFSSQLSLYSSGVHHNNSKLLLDQQDTVQKTKVRFIRYFRRRPIDVVENIKGNYIQDYVKEQEFQSGVWENDETCFPPKNNVLSVEEERVKSNTGEEDLYQHDTNGLALQEDINPKQKQKQKQKKKDKKNKKIKKAKDSVIPENVNKKEIVLKNLNIQQYSKALPKVRGYLEEGKSVYVRENEDFFYVEGWRLLGEALNKGLRPLAIFFSRSRLFCNLIPSVAKDEEELTALLNLYPLYKTPYNVFKLWSSLVTPPGVVGVFRTSEASEKVILSHKMSENSFPLTVILDEIRDPNNLGSIFRTAAASGVQQIILMKGCCDIWDPKVFRATCGAQFHMNCLSKVPWKLLESHLPPSPNVFLADSYCNREFKHFDQVDEEIDPADGKETLLILENSLAESEKDTVYETTNDGHKLRINYSYDNFDHLDLFRNITFRKISYEDAEFFTNINALEDQHSILIIGGEKGLSLSAKKFALECNALQVGIPLLNDVESLNSAVATGIFVYSAQRQYKSIKKQQNQTQTFATDSSTNN